MPAVFDGDGGYLGEMPTDRSQFVAHVIRVLEADLHIKFEVFNHFKMAEGALDADIVSTVDGDNLHEKGSV